MWLTFGFKEDPVHAVQMPPHLLTLYQKTVITKRIGVGVCGTIFICFLCVLLGICFGVPFDFFFQRHPDTCINNNGSFLRRIIFLFGVAKAVCIFGIYLY